MSSHLRLGGRGRLPDGGIVVWSVADGARGRRWRWVVDDIGILREAGLVELDVDGGLLRLEISSSAGLLTLHPEKDGSIHGNVVNDAGVRPIALAVSGRPAIRIDGDPFGSALLQGTGEGIGIGPGFAVAREARAAPSLPLDVRGVPVLDESTEWSLEAGSDD